MRARDTRAEGGLPMVYYVARNGVQQGPYSQQQVEEFARSGMIRAADLAWRTGEAAWQPLGELLPGLNPPPLPAVDLRNVYTAPPRPRVTTGPEGIGGWLLFYCITLTMIGPLFTVANILSTWTQISPLFAEYPRLANVMLFENVGMAVIIAYGFVVGCIVWSGNPQGKRRVKEYLIIRLAGFVLIEAVAILMLIGLPVEMVAGGIGGVIGATIREGIYFTIWWLYFLKSVRVRNTYGE